MNKAIIQFAILMMAFVVAMTSCRKSEATDSGNGKESIERQETPQINVYFVPLDGISNETAAKLSNEFYKNFAKRRNEFFETKVLGHEVSPDSCRNDAKTRFRADKLVKWLRIEFKDTIRANQKQPDVRNYIIGVTNKDISLTIHNHADYGILGLSYLGKGNVSVISTYRLKRPQDLWKLAAHEFCHGFYACPHCPDELCIMADAKGGNPHFEIKDSLCTHCSAICTLHN